MVKLRPDVEKEFRRIMKEVLAENVKAVEDAKPKSIKEPEEEAAISDEDIKAMVQDEPEEEEYRCGNCGYTATSEFAKCPKCGKKCVWE